MFQIIDLKKLLFFYIDNVLKNRTFDQISDSENELFAAKTQPQFSEDQSEVSPKEIETIAITQFFLYLRKENLSEDDEIVHS
ncbi:MAG: hypothetical protein VX297_00650 [Bacteroidota bacterium]|nr:hypothetical protein [Bacteroidota bacterium]MEE3085366.1 hypothetical protein [Bacteroidota bacterium]